MRNAYAQTVVAQYSVRARPGAPVATPLTWPEVQDPGLDPGQFTISTVRGRLESTDDPWDGFSRKRHSLSRPSKRLAKPGPLRPPTPRAPQLTPEPLGTPQSPAGAWSMCRLYHLELVRRAIEPVTGTRSRSQGRERGLGHRSIGLPERPDPPEAAERCPEDAERCAACA